MLLYAAAAIAFAGSIAATGYVAFGLGQDHEIAKAKRTEDIIRETREAAAQGAAQAIANLEVRHVTVQRATEREIIDRGVQWRERDCAVSADWLREFNAATPGQPAAAAGDGKLPAEAAPAGR